MPLAGKLVNRMNPKVVLAAGIVATSYASYRMCLFDLHTDFATVFWARGLQGFTMSFVFIPLLTLTLSGIKKENMANATSVFNSLRTLGGSFGVAFIATMLSRRAQFHQSRLGEHFTSFDQVYSGTAEKLSGFLQGRGMDAFSSAKGSSAMIYDHLQKQASMMAFSDIFFLLAFVLIVILPLVFFLVRIRHKAEAH
jgi:DHA2 family multidrug resistance protein